MSSKSIKLSQACEGMIRYKQAAGKSDGTINDYRVTFKKLLLFFKEDPPFANISRSQMIEFFAWLQHEYISIPDGVAPRGSITLSSKTVRNIHTNLSALWHWASDEELVSKNIIRTIDAPPVSERVIQTFTKEEIEVLLKACETSRSWKTRPQTKHTRSTADRDRAIVLLLLDTGIRASELCGIEHRDLNMSNHVIKVRGKGPGRDGKERLVYFGRRTGQALWKALLPRINTIREDDPLIVVGFGENWRPMTRGHLRLLLHRLGDKAGLRNVHPHRFRHTFAINYLRNEGDVFTLKELLGHSDLEMTEHYARIAQIDTENGHRKAGPVDNWRL
jgi:integrase/recombinase XerD